MSEQRLAEENSRSDHYLRFSADEYEQRRSRIRKMMRKEGLDALIIHGNARFEDTNISYLTNYRPPFTTHLVFFKDPNEEPTLFVDISNHLQYVRETSKIDDLRLLLPAAAEKVTERIQETNAADGTVGIVGADPRYDLTIPHKHHITLEKALDAKLVDTTSPYLYTTAVKSEEELDWIERASTIVDEGIQAITERIEPGVTERELEIAFRTACLEAGGDVGATFISSAAMKEPEPGECLPWKAPSKRKLKQGDVITTEVGATYGGYTSQIHRPFALGRQLTERYNELFDIAEKCTTIFWMPSNPVTRQPTSIKPCPRSRRQSTKSTTL